MTEQGSDEREYPVYWKGELVGSISHLMQDMWYIDGDWQAADTPASAALMDVIAHLVDKAFWKSKLEDYVWIEIPSLKMGCTVVHVPIENRITFHMMIQLRPPKRYM